MNLSHQSKIRTEVRLQTRFANFVELTFRRADEVRHLPRPVFGGREKGGVERDVANVAAGDLELPGHKIDVQFLLRHFRRKRSTPDLRALLRVWKRELDQETQPPQEG